MVVSDMLIGLAYVSISLSLYALVKRIKLPFTGMFLAFGLFIGACGATHFMEVYTLWTPDYWLSALVKVVTATASVATAVNLVKISPRIFEIAKAAKLAEQRHLQSIRDFFELAEALPLFAWTADANGRVTYFNQRFYDYSGLNAENADKRWAELLHPDDRLRVAHAWKESVRTGEPYQIEYRFGQAHNGEYRWFLTRAVPVRDHEGHIEKWLGTSTDIDDQKRAQQADALLAEAGRILASTLEPRKTMQGLGGLVVPAVADWLIVDLIMPDAQIERIVVSPPGAENLATARSLEKFTPTRESGHVFWSIIESGKPALVTGLATEELIQGRSINDEHRDLLHKIGVTSVLHAPLRSRGKVMGALHFMTTRQSQRLLTEKDTAFLSELANRAATALDNARLYQNTEDALRSRDEFFSIASHELKTPMTSLKLQLQMMRRSIDRQPTGDNKEIVFRSKLEQADRQTNRLVKLVDNLLDVSRIRNQRFGLDLSEFDLSQLTQETIARMADQAQTTGSQLRSTIEPSIVGTWDKLRVEQAITNLVSNAIKYGRGNPIDIVLQRSAQGVTLSVHDQGIGIPTIDQARIFARFERAVSERDFAGLGLGLYITSQIVQAHNGSIRVESTPDVGSSFVLELPLRTRETANEEDYQRRDQA